jgi:hypothetical protein
LAQLLREKTIMGEAQRRRKAGHNPGLYAQRLVASWRGESDEGSPEVLDEITALNDPARILDRALDMLDGEEEAADFLIDLFSDAGDLCLGMTLPNGGEAVGNLSLFTIPVLGLRSEIDQLAESDAFTGLTKLLRTTGVAKKNSNVVLCPVPLDMVGAADLLPHEVRRLAITFQEVATTCPDMEKITKAVRRLIPVRGAEGAADASGEVDCLSTMLFVGARFSIDEIDGREVNERDHFDPPPYDLDAGEDVNTKILEDAEEKRTQEDDDFVLRAQRLVESHGWSLWVDPPACWTEGLAALAYLRITTGLTLQASHLGKTPADSDATHIALDGGMLHMSMAFSNDSTDPITTPMALMLGGNDALSDWLSENSREIIEHDSLDGMREALRHQRPRLTLPPLGSHFGGRRTVSERARFARLRR